MFPVRGAESGRARRLGGQCAPRVLVAGIVLLLAACGGGSTTGGGTANSPFVGTYDGSTTVNVSSDAGPGTATEPVTIFVHRDGLVQLGDAQSTIYASGPLRGSTVRIDGDASALVDTECSGTISLAGAFEADEDGGAAFQGSWSSSDAACFGVAGTISGLLEATRVSTSARASRVLETSSPALRQAFRQASD